MGNWMSGPVETPEQRRARLQREHGILMPPSFVNGTLLPIANQAALQASQALYTIYIGLSAWIMNLSQVLTFDRPVLNPLDERAPNIRQTLGWVVQVEMEPQASLSSQLRLPSDHAFHTSGSSNSNKTSWSAGATFQLNRNTAYKAVCIDGHTLLYGAIFKRWSHPRLTCSFFHSLHIPTGQHGQFGLGLELETAATTTTTTATDDATEYPPPPSVPCHHGPPTKIRIPKHKLK